MTKTHYPFSLHKFVTNQDPELIHREVGELLDFVVLKQEGLIRDKFDDVVSLVSLQPELIRGSVNRAGAKLGFTPTYSPEEKKHYRHMYNLTEMMRANLTSLVGSYAQRRNILNVIAMHPDADYYGVSRAYRGMTGKRVSVAQVGKIFNALNNTGSIDSTPRSPSKLPLWATDTHHCFMSVNGRELTLNLKTQSGLKTLTFTIPPHIPNNAKITRPTIIKDTKNRIQFQFTAETPAPKPQPNQGWLGVDLGVVKSFTATGITGEMRSQSWSDTDQIVHVSDKIRVLQGLVVSNQAKREQNKDRYPEKHEVQAREVKRLRKKITRLKNFRAHLIANQLVKIAQLHNLGISLEDLSWVPNSHWEQSIIQTKIQDEATRYGVKVKKVNARNTSKQCSSCFSLDTYHTGRKTICKTCSLTHDRDENASKNIAYRALGIKQSVNYYYRWQTRGTTGVGHLYKAPLVDITTITTNPSLVTRKTRI